MISTSTSLMATGSVPADAEHTRRLARRRAQASGELGKVVGGVQGLARELKRAGTHEVVPVGDAVAQGTTVVAERDATVHAPRRLLPHQLRRRPPGRPRASRAAAAGPDAAWAGAGRSAEIRSGQARATSSRATAGSGCCRLGELRPGDIRFGEFGHDRLIDVTPGCLGGADDAYDALVVAGHDGGELGDDTAASCRAAGRRPAKRSPHDAARADRAGSQRPQWRPARSRPAPG